MTTNPAVEGKLANNMTMARIKLRSRRSDFENMRPISFTDLLEQSPLVFKIDGLDVDGVPGHPKWQFQGHALSAPGQLLGRQLREFLRLC